LAQAPFCLNSIHSSYSRDTATDSTPALEHGTHALIKVFS
jgi:hypothetical protein